MLLPGQIFELFGLSISFAVTTKLLQSATPTAFSQPNLGQGRVVSGRWPDRGAALPLR